MIGSGVARIMLKRSCKQSPRGRGVGRSVTSILDRGLGGVFSSPEKNGCFSAKMTQFGGFKFLLHLRGAINRTPSDNAPDDLFELM